MHYNWHRHYDPIIGRYTQPDPLGFVDGPSVYAYAQNSVVMRVDPDGLLVIGPQSKPPSSSGVQQCNAIKDFCKSLDKKKLKGAAAAAVWTCLKLLGGEDGPSSPSGPTTDRAKIERKIDDGNGSSKKPPPKDPPPPPGSTHDTGQSTLP